MVQQVNRKKEEGSKDRFRELKLSLSVFFSNKSAVAGAIIVILYVIDALVMEFYPRLFGISHPNTLTYNFIDSVPLPPSPAHLLGTTYGGLDLLKSILKAVRFDLAYSLVVVVAGAFIGTILGVLSAYRGGYLDELLMRITDIFFSVPYLVLALAVAFVLGRTLDNLVLALIVVWWPIYARYSRGLTLSAKNMTFVDAAKVSGASSPKIIFKHILPNVLPPIFVQISLDLGTVVLVFSTLAFIGFLPNANIPELGMLASVGLQYVQTAPWAVLFPGIAITLFALGVNLMGDGLRDVLDPRRRS